MKTALTLDEISNYPKLQCLDEPKKYKSPLHNRPQNIVGHITYANGDICVFLQDAEYLGNSFVHKIADIKPILRPLSDLVKEIEHNGERFVPMVKLVQDVLNFEVNIKELTSNKDYCFLDFSGYNEFGNSILYDYEQKLFALALSHTFYPYSHQYDLMQKLFEWHFDVFGLIEKGLAVSIYDLKQENYAQ